jgi:hypothetical protein
MGLWSDIGSVAGGAIGTIIAPGVGTGIGASLGGALGGLGDKEDDGGEYQGNNYDSQIQSVVGSLINSHIGRDEAALIAGQAVRGAKDQIERFDNNSNFAGNANVTSAFYNKSMTNAQEGSAKAYLGGAEVDQQAKLKGAQLGAQMSEMDYQRWLERKKRKQGLSQQPSFLSALGEQAGSLALGSFMGTGKTPSPTGVPSSSDIA